MNMEISSVTLSLPKPPRSLPFSSSNSTFFNTTAFFNKTKSCNSLVLGKTTSGSQRAKKGLTCNALFGLGVPELVVIAGVAALVFGPKKLPEVGKSIGKTVKSFQQAAKEFESELKKEPESESETPGEQPKAIIEEKKQDVEVSSSKESV
ncbi:sec-independent protein translocase protein TATA [Populus alba x Populus x berolinensis]|uniref:Uncharacterized protein n=2 Tax=Populus alba TaxID=43335 RepID=A0ACC4B4Z4_POPAL|nr:sec-independent protein translocase protein TATA, chloroplastic-like [Populus alba]KAJ6883785.1 sec-independent protein translocase protein TATA [Populus alba x Populus x berolinensis]